MSEVDGMNGLVGAENDEGGDQQTSTSQSQSNEMIKIIAPTLRVEELRDCDGHSSSFGSEDEGVSHGEASDRDQPQQPFVPPDDELKEKIMKQVEFYFSDVNILKDKFLLKHVRRNKMGYVSLKLITSFKKVKSMTKDYRVVAHSLRLSDQLEVNEEGTKVRRTNPLPEYDETTPSRTVIAVNMPYENPTIENVAELFTNCGEIALIRILRPGKSIPPDVKKYLNKHPELGNTICAVVEFEKHECAKKACETMTQFDSWRKGMRVVLLATQNQRKEKRDSKGAAKERKDAVKSDNEEGIDEEKKKRPKGGKKKKTPNRVSELGKGESPMPSSGSELDVSDHADPRRPRSNSSGFPRTHRSSLSPIPDPNRLSPNTTPRSTPKSSPRNSPRNSPTMRRRNMHGKSPLAANLSPGTSPKPSPRGSPEMERKRKDSYGTEQGGGSSPSSPWVQRRLKAAETSPLASTSPGASPRMGRRLADMEGVIRQPKGPDGTNGFHIGAGRGKLRSETV